MLICFCLKVIIFVLMVNFIVMLLRFFFVNVFFLFEIYFIGVVCYVFFNFGMIMKCIKILLILIDFLL